MPAAVFFRVDRVFHSTFVHLCHDLSSRLGEGPGHIWDAIAQPAGDDCLVGEEGNASQTSGEEEYSAPST
jgi:hypothetical protein